MSVPPEILQRMMGQGAQPGMPGASPGSGGGMPPGMSGSGGPAAAPISSPQKKEGLKAAAMTNLSIAQNMLEQALTAFEPGTPEYKAAIKALNTLSGVVGKRDSSDLVPAEVLHMTRQLPQMGGGTDVQRMIMQQMAQGGRPQQAAGAACETDMAQRYLEPSAEGLRKPTDPQKENGQVINPPRYAEHGGLDSSRRIAQKNPLTISKPGGGRRQ